MQKNSTLKGNLNETYLVQKCEPMLLMRTVPFELGELKILDTYLSRINSHDDNCRTVTFTKSEYEELMGLKNVDIRTLKKYTKSILSKVVELPMPDGYVQFTLFTKSVCKKNEYDQQIIELTCSEDAKSVFFNIEKLGYLQYELKNVLSLTSKYSLLLYLYLRKERYRSDWVIPLKELREQRFDIKKNETYLNFKYFKRDILDKSVNEITEKTDVKFTYTTVKTGRRITGIHFHLIKEPSREVDTNQLSFEDMSNERYEEASIEEYGSERLALLADACNKEFSKSEIEEIFEIIALCPMPNSDQHGIDIARYHYLAQLYAKLNVATERALIKGKPIKDRYKYFITLLKKEQD